MKNPVFPILYILSCLLFMPEILRIKIKMRLKAHYHLKYKNFVRIFRINQTLNQYKS
jgi:hypothetical protein